MKNPLVIDIKAPFFKYRYISLYPWQQRNCESSSINILIHIDCANELQKNETEIMRLRGRAHCVVDLSVPAFSHK